ncbi:class II fructose-bisphosphate aldolase [Spiroplasma endosymbiont of Labia minor]|uniref:class II fructose-bisphosphate aldolase n=1 Tax=Spiroplasma endosymbiont of Labia minor TaxID=3066305 RepID=UPI0030CA8F19
MKASLKLELKKAQNGGYAIPAFNFDNLEMAKGIILAAEEKNAPVILMVTESAAKYIGLEIVYDFAPKIAQRAKVPVILHWDHGFDIELVKRACDNNFSSVMLDASKESYENNVKFTKEIVAYAHARGIDVESEIGHVGGKEDDNSSRGSDYTSVSEAVSFVKDTNIDALAIAVGTAHGIYTKKIDLQFDLITKINQEVNTPLVLHGSSGVSLSDLQKAIKCGIAKINIGTDLKQANANALKQWFEENPNGFDARKFGEKAIQSVKTIAMQKIDAFYAANKA